MPETASTTPETGRPKDPGQHDGVIRSAFLGAIMAVDSVGHCLALATICFAGALSSGLGLATAALILGTAVSTVALFLFGGFKVALGIAQDVSIAVLAPAIGMVALAVTGPTEVKVATGLMVMGASAILTGLGFWLVGRFGLGRLVRVFPYPVAAGFLASSGVLLVLAALAVVGEGQGVYHLLTTMPDTGPMINLIAAVAMALCLVLSLRFWTGALPVLAVIGLAVAGLYIVCGVAGVSRAQALDLGLFSDVESHGALGIDFAVLSQVDVRQLITIAPVLAAVVLLNLIGLLLNTSGVELATRDDVDINRELRVAGLSNMLIGMFGGLASYLQAGSTLIVAKLGARAGPLLVGQLCVLLLACFFAPQIAALVPKFVAAGLLLFIGFSMIDDWLLASLRRLPRTEYVIVFGIVLITALVGILEAIAAGLLMAVLSFALSYARLPVIRRRTDASARRSILDRAPEHSATLSTYGSRIRIIQLQGALFFGSIDQMIEDLTAPYRAGEKGDALILDLTEVSKIDVSACAALGKLAFVLGQHGVQFHLADPSDVLSDLLVRWDMPLATGTDAPAGTIHLWDNFDDALRQCEDRLLAQVTVAQTQQSIASVLSELSDGNPRTGDLLSLMTPISLEPGDFLIAAKDDNRDIFFVESGQLQVQITGPEGQAIPVRAMGPGAVVGEVAILLEQPRSADVVARLPSRVFRLSADNIARIQSDDTELAAVFYAVLARSVSLKMLQTNALLIHARKR